MKNNKDSCNTSNEKGSPNHLRYYSNSYCNKKSIPTEQSPAFENKNLQNFLNRSSIDTYSFNRQRVETLASSQGIFDKTKVKMAAGGGMMARQKPKSAL
jgi:hypothetical protein